VFTALLHSNDLGADHIENTAFLLLLAFISAETFLPSRRLAMIVYSGPDIQAFRRHVTLL
jgi:hypothetical protein